MIGRNPILAEAERVVPSAFDPVLRAAGFTVVPNRKPLPNSNAWLYGRAWERSSGGPRPHYVNLSLSVHPRDIPWFLSVSLGEGPNRFPENEWNGVPLWRLAEAGGAVEPGRDQAVDRPGDVAHVVATAAADLATYAQAFLAGDLEPFFVTRESLTEGRSETTMASLNAMLAREIPRLYGRLALKVLIVSAVVAIGLRLRGRRSD